MISIRLTDRRSESQITEESCHRVLWSLHEFRVHLLLTFIRPTELFNTEKKFGLIEERFSSIMIIDMDTPGLPTPSGPVPTIREMFDRPESIVPPNDFDKQSKSESEEKRRRRQRKPKFSDLLTKFQRNCKETDKVVRAINEAVNDQPAQITPLPRILHFRTATVSTNIPRRIRQRLFDLDFVFVEINTLLLVVKELRNHARCILNYWFGASEEAWEYGKKHIHEMSSLRLYEYHRLSLSALIEVAHQESMKLAKFFFSKKGSSLLTPPLARALHLDGDQTLEQLKRGWDDLEAVNDRREHLPPVDEMVSDLETIYERHFKMRNDESE